MKDYHTVQIERDVVKIKVYESADPFDVLVIAFDYSPFGWHYWVVCGNVFNAVVWNDGAAGLGARKYESQVHEAIDQFRRQRRMREAYPKPASLSVIRGGRDI